MLIFFSSLVCLSSGTARAFYERYHRGGLRAVVEEFHGGFEIHYVCSSDGKSGDEQGYPEKGEVSLFRPPKSNWKSLLLSFLSPKSLVFVR